MFMSFVVVRDWRYSCLGWRNVQAGCEVFVWTESVVWRRTWPGEVMLVQPSVADEASAMPAFPACPYLPEPPEMMDAEALSAHGPVRDSAFYLTALTYAHCLWLRGFPSRAILKLDRALGADLRGDEPALLRWPLPYAAVGWFLRHTPEGRFVGNPRVHFQHLADRMTEPRREQRKWRIWACWSLCRVVLPDLPGDPNHSVEEPTIERIAHELQIYGVPRELEMWQAAMGSASQESSALVR
jgi:hypothetical protein